LNQPLAGKAAIDVVGSQSGKSVGSVLQQALLILTGGTVGGIVPLLAVFYAVMLHRWTDAVSDLAEHYDPAHVHRMSVMASIDEDDEPRGSPVSSDNGAIAAAPGLRRNENSTSRGNGNGHSEQPFPASA
jgi:ATP:ADP antiporter, AAA family